MRKHISAAQKSVAVFLVSILLLNTMGTPLEAVGSELIGYLQTIAADGDTPQNTGPPSSTELEDLRPPSYNYNPNPIDTESFILPIYTDRTYRYAHSHGMFNRYQSYRGRTPDRSQYYTGSVMVLTDRSASQYNGTYVTSDLPYTEERSLMFHPELTLHSADASGSMSGVITMEQLNRMTPEGTDIWDYLDPDQAQMMVSGNLILGHGSLSTHVFKGMGDSDRYKDEFYDIRGNESGTGYKIRELGMDGEPNNYEFKTVFPLNESVTSVRVDYTAYRNSAITDPYAVLLDNQAPYIKDISVTMEVDEKTDESFLVMNVEFNEGIRYTSENWLTENRNSCYVQVHIWNSTAGEQQTARLFVDRVDGGKNVTFRGSIGKLHYCNFSLMGRIDGSREAAYHENAYSTYTLAVGALDLADGMMVSPGVTANYDNGLQVTTSSGSYYGWKEYALLCDHAGNPFSMYLASWSSHAESLFSHSPNSFEAEEIYVYNDKTLGVELGEIDASAATDSDMFVGPGKDMTVHVYLSRVLEDEDVWKKIYITLNILDKDGKELKVYPSSATKYTNSEVYADGEKIGTLLKFENIPLSADMSLDVAEGGEPLVWVTGLGTDYDPKTTGYPTAYPYVNEPDNIMYGDFTPPAVAVRKTVEDRLTADTDYHRLSMEVSIEDVQNYTRIAGLVGEQAYISLSGGVDRETPFLYYISTDPIPSEELSAYDTSAVMAPKAAVTLGGFTMMNNSVKMYVHILIKSGMADLYVDQLQIGVNAYDLVQNEVALEPPAEVEYLIDEIPPVPSIVTKRVTAEDGNTTLKLSVDVTASDHSRIDRLLYCFGRETPDENVEWQVAVIQEFGATVNATVEKTYGTAGESPADGTVYTEVLWVKAVDTHGNHSEPVGTPIELSLEKPATSVKYDGDPNRVSTAHKILVSGPEKSLLEATAYTRVTLTPKDSEYAYVTVIGTGQKEVDVLALKDLTWYRVKSESNIYEDVSGPVTVANDPGGLLAPLINHYGDLKVSFENGYGDETAGKDMTPKAGLMSDGAAAASYFADPNYYIVRYASPLLGDLNVHNVDFGAIMDCAIPYDPDGIVIQTSGTAVVPDADPGAAPYVFNQQYKGISPMRNARIHFSISNIANADFGLLDFDYENSYAELVRVKQGDETEDTVVATQGLWATGNQYFTVRNLMDNGENYVSGAYYLRVTVASTSGHTSTYESSKVILDAQTADGAGMWAYSYQTFASLTKTDRYQEVIKEAQGEAFEDIGITVMMGGETSRDRYFATYSFGVEDLKVILKAPDTVRTYEGVTIGEVEGFKLWNILSAPTQDEINARRFELTPVTGSPDSPLTDTLVRQARTSAIYTSETIPKGMSGFSGLFLVKGTNTFCYQVKMRNGYVTPVRQFTVTVSDEAPVLSIAVDGYQPSLDPSQIHSVINADHVRYMVDTAYSINGSGNVSVDLWAKYNMNLGRFDEGTGSVREAMTSLDFSVVELQQIATGMQTEEYADFTENSYTADFPDDLNFWCTGVFVATDEYGGVTLVAPQLGDMKRLDVDQGSVSYGHEVDISYVGAYTDDPYTLNDSQFRFRIWYNQPTYFGAQLLTLESYLVEQDENGDEIRIKDIQIADPSLQYNMFNIQTNDIHLYDGAAHGSGAYRYVAFGNGYNQQHVLLSNATVTLSGGHLSEAVTLDFLTGDLIVNGERTDERNTVGYMYGASLLSDLRFYLANPPADDTHTAGEQTEVSYVFNYGNAYGDTYTKEGTVTLTYVDYHVSAVTMTEHGAELTFSFAQYDPTNAGVGRTGQFQNGEYEVTVPDYFGRTGTYGYTVSNQTDPDTEIRYEKFTNTTNPVTVTIKSMIGLKLVVDVTDYEIMSVANNNTPEVTVTISKNTRFSYRYLDAEGTEKTFYIDVNNIFETNPRAVYSVDLANPENYNVADDGTKYRFGSLTVYLTDSNFILTDKYTGERPSFTFVPGGPQFYTFKADEIEATLGDETVTLKNDITIVAGVVLYEVPEAEFSTDNDTTAPNVQVQAYSKLGEAYSNEKLAMQLTSIRNVNPLTKHYDYQTFSYVGNRANMSEVLDRIGWSTAYRFTVETVDASRVRLFVKNGLYAEAPDFNTGVSDEIEGVNLNSKLLTVTKNAKFTLFVVDSFNNYASVAFHVTNISAAPVPSLFKMPLDHGRVRVYVIPPEDVANEDIAILSPADGSIETDAESPYHLMKYVDFNANDDYEILYTITYNGVPVTDSIDVSVTEIIPDEIEELGQTWSSNKTAEATANAVTAEIRFSHNVASIHAQTVYDAAVVSFEVAGNTVRVTYTENHSAIAFTATADNYTYVTVSLDAVTNIDHSAPVVDLISATLAANGRSLTLVLATNERTIFREGNGRVGEAAEDENGVVRYYHTIRITENGKHTFTFVDMSGIQSVYTYETDKLVFDGPEVLYNTAPQDGGAQVSPESLALETGDTVYVKPTRDVTATLSATAPSLTIPAGEWFALTIPESAAGIPPYIIYTDVYGNVLTHQFSKVIIPDGTAPEIIVSKLTYPVQEGTARAQVEAELLANFLAFDDRDAEVTRTVEFTEDLDSLGITNVTYTAIDSAGNMATVHGKLRITSIYEPVVFIGDKRIISEEGMNLKSGENVTLNIGTEGISYKLILASGKRTAAQMKGLDATYEGAAESVDLGVLDDGFYTILIVTEQRDYFRIFISIEDF